MVRRVLLSTASGGTKLAISASDKKIDLLFLISASTKGVAALFGLA